MKTKSYFNTCFDQNNIYQIGDKYNRKNDVCRICSCINRLKIDCHDYKSCKELNCDKNLSHEKECCDKLKCECNFYIYKNLMKRVFLKVVLEYF